jgi:hypothetical protein
MTTFIIVVLIILSVVLLGFYLHQAEKNSQLERVVWQQKKYIEAYNAWYKPEVLKEVNKEQVKKNYERELKFIQDKFKQEMANFDKVAK